MSLDCMLAILFQLFSSLRNFLDGDLLFIEDSRLLFAQPESQLSL